MNSIFVAFSKMVQTVSLVKQIVIAIVVGLALAVLWPSAAMSVGLLGQLFVNGLKAVAPILVFMLVLVSIAHHKAGTPTFIRPILLLYVVGTFLAALTAVMASFIFPTELALTVHEGNANPPENVAEVLRVLLFKIVDNPVNALVSGNFIGLIAWAVALGFALRHSSESTKSVIQDLASAISAIVKFLIRLAPLGIFGLVASTIASAGLGALLGYGRLLMVLIGSMLFVALVLNPMIVFWKIRRNPYPLVLQCLHESGITAFFTRSSAANIPVNMALAEKLKLHKDTYSVSIPLGASVNMAGAAITITVLTLSAVNTMGIQTDFATALLLSVIASVSACGASGVAGGSLLLIPLACGLFGISNDVAMQVVAVGFIIGVLQDSAETALNSSTDVIFTAAACKGEERLSGEATT